MLRMLLIGLLIWFLYNLIFRFIIPIYTTTREMKKKFRDIKSAHDQMNQQQDFAAQGPFAEKTSSKKPKEDYIDFEEIKEPK